MEPGGGGPGPDPASLEVISSPGLGNIVFGVLISQAGPPSAPRSHLAGSPRSPLPYRRLRLGSAPRPPAHNCGNSNSSGSDDMVTGPHTGWDSRMGGWDLLGLSAGLRQADLLQGFLLACVVLNVQRETNSNTRGDMKGPGEWGHGWGCPRYSPSPPS